MTITIPAASLVLLMGASGAGKSTFARRHFRKSEVLSSDFCRALVCDDESNQEATEDAFQLLHSILAKRLKWKRVTVIDATNVQAGARKPLMDAARRCEAPLVGIVFTLPEDVYLARNLQRTYRVVPSDVIREQVVSLETSLEGLENEGFSQLYRLRDVSEADSVVVVRG